VLNKRLDQVTPEDIHAFIADAPPESLFLELKEDLPSEQDNNLPPEERRRSRWHSGDRKITDTAKEKLAAEIVAFANADGGTLILGIEETDDAPKKPKGLRPLPEPAELADRLRRALREVIEPPLPVFEAAGVATQDDGAGVVILRVGASRLAPHRSKRDWQCYVRREDEKRRMDMREVQEMVIQRDRGMARFERQFDERASAFENGARQARDFWWSLLALPIDDVKVNADARGGILPFAAPVFVAREGHPVRAGAHFDQLGRRKPRLGGSSAEDRSEGEYEGTTRVVEERYYRNGCLKQSYVETLSFTGDHRREVHIGLFAVLLCRALNWVIKVREAAQEPTVEFGLQFIIACRSGINLWLIERDYFPSPARSFFWSGVERSEIYSAGPAPELPSLAQRMIEDVANLFGADWTGHALHRESFGLSDDDE